MEGSIEIVRQLYDAFSRQDSVAALALIDPGIAIDYEGVVPDACGSYSGYAGMGKLLQTILASFDVDRFEVVPEEIAEAPEGRVAVAIHQRGVGKASGAAVEIRIGQVWTIRDGKAVRWQIFKDRDEAFAAVGLA